MKEEALKLADELEKPVPVPNQPDMIYIDGHRMYGAQMIRRLVEELDKQGKPVAWMPIISFRSDKTLVISKVRTASHCVPLYTSSQTKPLSDDEIISMFEHPDDFNCIDFARAIEERHGIK